MARETCNLEFKQSMTSSFLKTVSAFANYSGGTILFGVDDNGQAIGLEDTRQACLTIENKINDSISPQPDYSLKVREIDSIVELTVKPGHAKPYLYHAKAYKRNDSSTVETDAIELSRLILEGNNITFEELLSTSQDLTFDILAAAITQHLGLESFSTDTLKTLELLDKEGKYNNAAALLADKNKFPGLDTAVFGDSINVIRQRKTFAGVCVLEEVENTMAVFEDVYFFEEIDGLYRTRRERIPRDAFRETIANAVVHRVWDVPAHIRVAMFDDRIEVTSPGGLPAGLTPDEYLSEMVSIRRNRILAGVFLRLGLIEAFGTGIARIKEAYGQSASKPKFEVTPNLVKVTLPVVARGPELTKDQKVIYDLLSKNTLMSAGEITEMCSFSRSKVNRILNRLVETGAIEPQGEGRGKAYLKK